MMNRNIVLHCHFFKNAGTTIDWALQRSFGAGFYENKLNFYSVPEWDDHLRGLVANHEYTVISSHVFSLQPPQMEGITFSPIAMCRHPIERVTSVVAFEKKQKFVDTWGVAANTELTLQEYVEKFTEDGTSATIRNMHTLRFANRTNGHRVTEEDFKLAVTTVEQCQTIGVVEYFDESMVLFEEILRPVFPNLDLAYVVQNVNQVGQSTGERIQELRVQLGGSLYEKLVAKNAMDLKLYDIVTARFNSRIQAIPDFSYKLKRFKTRCLELQGDV